MGRADESGAPEHDGAISSEDHLPDGSPTSAKYNSADPHKGHDHTFFVQHSRDVFAD